VLTHLWTGLSPKGWASGLVAESLARRRVSARVQACLRTWYDCRNDQAARRQRVSSSDWGGWDVPTLTEMPYLYVASVIG
jgi:hypothetical protein